LTALTGAHLDAADDAIGAGCGRYLDAVGVAALVLEYGGEVDRGRVATDADGVKRAYRGRGGKSHEAQRSGREAPDQTPGQFSAFDATSLVLSAFPNGMRWFGASR